MRVGPVSSRRLARWLDKSIKVIGVLLSRQKAIRLSRGWPRSTTEGPAGQLAEACGASSPEPLIYVGLYLCWTGLSCFLGTSLSPLRAMVGPPGAARLTLIPC